MPGVFAGVSVGLPAILPKTWHAWKFHWATGLGEVGGAAGASRPLGANARTALSWRWGNGLAEVTSGGGGTGGQRGVGRRRRCVGRATVLGGL